MNKEQWFEMHMDDEKVRKMNRKQYYAARSWLRRVAHIVRLRLDGARMEGRTIIYPSTASVTPEKFK